LLRRAQAYDESALRARVAADPDDVEAQAALADIDLLSGNAEEGFARLLDLVRRTSGDIRDAARTHLVDLLDALDPADPAVLQARRDLANALF
jgi:putative thioredoxin